MVIFRCFGTSHLLQYIRDWKKKIWNTVDCQRSVKKKKRSKTHKRPKERPLKGLNRRKRAPPPPLVGSPLFPAKHNIKRSNCLSCVSYMLGAGGRKRAWDWQTWSHHWHHRHDHITDTTEVITSLTPLTWSHRWHHWRDHITSVSPVLFSFRQPPTSNWHKISWINCLFFCFYVVRSLKERTSPVVCTFCPVSSY